MIAGDESLPVYLTPRILAPYDYLVVGSTPLKNGQEAILEEAGRQIVKWKGVDAMPEKIKEQTTIEGSEQVRISIRYNPDSSELPIICHLLNQNYEPEIDEVQPVDIRISLNKRLLKKFGFVPHSATIHTFKHESSQLQTSLNDEFISFDVEELGI